MPVCGSCGEDNPARAQFCMACGSGLATDGPGGRDVRKTVTIVFCDLVDSVPLGDRLDPESLREVLSRYFEAMQAAVRRHGGTVEKFIGDAVLAVFGIPALHEDDALRAVRAAHDMREALGPLNDALEATSGVRLATHTGVNTGEVVVGDVAAGQRFATGDAVNVAARLQQVASAGEILIGERTHRMVRDHVSAERVERRLKGKADPVVAYELRGLRDGPAEPPGRTANLVGRDMELTVIRQAFARAASSRTCHLVTVLGPGGVGKTRLVSEALEGIDPPPRVLRGRCLSYGDGITLWPLREIVQDAVGTDGAGSVVDRLAAMLASVPRGPEVAAQVVAAVGLGPGAPPADLPWAVRTVLAGVAGRTPLVVVVDDVEHAEPALLDLLEDVAARAREVPLLLLCLARDHLLETREGWGGGIRNAVSLLLEPLDRAESDEVAGTLLGPGCPPAVRARVVQAAGGNPLFLEEIVAMLVDRGALRPGDGWVAGPGPDTIEIPETISALLAARIDGLDPQERRVLGAAAVVGRSFEMRQLEVLDVLAGADGLRLADVVDALVHKDLVRPEPDDGSDGYGFRHLLVRDAAYDALSKRDRAALHERFARSLLGSDGPAEARYAEIVGHHLERAVATLRSLGPPGDHDRSLARLASRHLGTAGRRALDRLDVAAARSLLERAVGLFVGAEEADDPDRHGLLPLLAEALVEDGDFEAARAVAAAALEQAERTGDAALRAHAILAGLLLSTSVEPEGWTDQAEPEAERAVELFARLDDDAGLAAAWGILAEVHQVRCRSTRSAEASLRAMEHARRAGMPEGRYVPGYVLSVVYGPTPVDPAEAICREILARPGVGPNEEAATLRGLGGLVAMQGRFDDARTLVRRSGEIWNDLGRRVTAAMGPAEMLGHVELLSGDPAAAERAMLPGYVELEALGEQAFRSTLSGMLARAAHLQGHLDQAERYAAEAELVSGSDDVYSQVLWRAARARVLADRGQLGAARSLADAAVELAETTDELLTQGDAMLDLAEVLRAAGVRDDALRWARTGLERFEAKGSLPSVERARALVVALG